MLIRIYQHFLWTSCKLAHLLMVGLHHCPCTKYAAVSHPDVPVASSVHLGRLPHNFEQAKLISQVARRRRETTLAVLLSWVAPEKKGAKDKQIHYVRYLHWHAGFDGSRGRQASWRRRLLLLVHAWQLPHLRRAPYFWRSLPRRHIFQSCRAGAHPAWRSRIIFAPGFRPTEPLSLCTRRRMQKYRWGWGAKCNILRRTPL